MQSSAQVDTNKWNAPSPDHYSFIKYDDNTLTHPAFLDSAFKKLYDIKRTRQGKINIIHLGDSHLQADMMTCVVRNGMHGFFGDAGRGIVFPQQLAGSNAPHDVHASSNTSWRGNRLTIAESNIKTGICGFGIESSSKDATIKMHIQYDGGPKDSFNRLVFFLGKKASTYIISDSDLKVPVTLATKDNIDNPSLVFTSTNLLAGFELKRADTDGNGDFCFYGVSLERSESAGVLYHTIGVNGAHFDQYNTNQLFWQQLEALNGDLFIVSLGTNEAQNQHLNEQTLNGIFQQFVAHIHQIAPHASILFTTPAGSYYRAKKPNASLLTITNAVNHFCESHKIACWDLYKISGAKNSAPGFKKNHLLGHDLVHYSELGYRIQGQLLLAALAKNYNAYIKAHPYVAPSNKPTPPKKGPQDKTTSLPKPAAKQPNAAKDNVKAKPIPVPKAPVVVIPENEEIPVSPPKKSKIKVKYED